MENTSQNAEKRENLVDDLKTVIQDAEDLLRNTGQQFSQQFDEKYRTARVKFEDTLQNAKTGLAGLEENLSIRTKEAVDTADQYVKANPWQSVGIGAAAGIIIGFLLLRK